MSIHDFPPLIETQTPERVPSGEVNRVATQGYLGHVGLRQSFLDDETNPVSYLPTHETLQYGINRIHSEVLAGLKEELAELAVKIERVERDIAGYIDRQRAFDERRADLKLFSAIVRPMSDEVKVPQVIQALHQARTDLYEQRDKILERRTSAVIELEALEEEDFELLKEGQ